MKVTDEIYRVNRTVSKTVLMDSFVHMTFDYQFALLFYFL